MPRTLSSEFGKDFRIKRLFKFETKRPGVSNMDWIAVISVDGLDIQVRCTTWHLGYLGQFRRLVEKRHGVILKDMDREEWRKRLNEAGRDVLIYFGSVESPEPPWEKKDAKAGGKGLR